MVTCKVCKKEKDPKSNFYSSSAVTCKECVKKRVKSNGTNYDLTEKGVFRVIYKTQKRNQKLRGHGEIEYTKKELVEWCKKNGFEELFISWRESGHKTALKPSIDRINDHKGYAFNNIRLGTWQQNRNHQARDIINAKGTSGKRCKALNKLDESFNIICEYVSYNSAVRDIGYSIEYQIKNKVKCRNGFYWQYK